MKTVLEVVEIAKWWKELKEGDIEFFAKELLEAVKEEIAAMKLVEDEDNSLVEEKLDQIIESL